jgi:MFS family permease
MPLLPPSATAETRLLIAARGLRATSDGFVSIILPAYLLLLGFDAVRVGVLATATLLGSALLTLAVGFTGVRRHTRAVLLAASLLMVLTGLGFAALDDFWPLLVIAFVGTLNPSSGDVSVFLPLEQALLARSVASRDRTALFARYSLVGALLGAAGTLLAALPELAASRGMAPLTAFKAMFLLYALGGVIAALIYRRLGRAEAVDGGPSPSALGPSRRVVWELAALFSLDAFAGGLVVQSLLALWLLQAFELSLAVTAQLFFWWGLLTALSYLVAAPLARRIGLINTMVFTHLGEPLPGSASLRGRALAGDRPAPFAQPALADGCADPHLLRHGRGHAGREGGCGSLTAVPRSLAAALSPSLAGWMLGAAAFAWPLLLAGTLKITYDLMLLARFRRLRPPQEQQR